MVTHSDTFPSSYIQNESQLPIPPVHAERAQIMPRVHSRDEGEVGILRALALCGAIVFPPPQISSGVISDVITSTERG